ncbi:TetR/AcrR family transcriptional regulator [Nakamurella sp.]|uniref:TetR/AcrR family transcriptional regulator n=1 Tax=Nakamurella sp. TaxID=1869182 RepID=UPI00378318E8
MPVITDRPVVLADAAIGLIAGGGIRALTHRAVDAAAGVPPGTTSYHFRTRRELLRGVLVRIAQINAERLARLPGPPTDSGGAPATRAARLAEADQLATRVAVFVDGQLGEHRDRTLARMACEIEVASDPDLREILHAGGIFRTLAIGAVTRLGATDPPRSADGLIALLDGLQYDRLVGVGSLTAAPAGTQESRAEIAAVVRSYLAGLVPA